MEFRLGPVTAAVRIATTMGVATGLLSACGGDDFLPTNNLPTNVTQQTITVYPATTPAAGTTAATQDLLTAGLGKTGLALATAPAYADRSIRPRSSCAAMRSTATTAASSIRRPPEVSARSTARTSTSMAWPPLAKE